MKKKLVGLLCGAVVVSMALPALALESTFSGYSRTQGYVQTTRSGGTGAKAATFDKDLTAETFVVQRLRLKLANKINDLLSVVYFAEVDTDWGNPSHQGTAAAAGGGAGGGLSADTVNVETKNVYVDLKPSKDFPASLRIGVQGLADNIQNIYLNDDAAALLIMSNFDALSLNVGWSKFAEGDVSQVTDDTDLYFLQAGYKISDTVKVGGELFHKAVNSTKTTETTLDVNGAFVVGPVNLDAFLAYQFGKANKDAANEEDIGALALSVNGTMKMDALTFGARLIYFGADEADDADASFNGDQGGLTFSNEGLNIFLADGLKSDLANDRAVLTAVQGGYGLLGIVLKAKYDFAPYYVKGAIGYFQTLTDEANDDPATEIEGTGLGTEIALEAGMKVADAATLSLRASYALLGDAYKGSATGGEDPDNAYMAALMLNVPF